jgi:rod shape-determining protein MreD
MRNLKLIIWAVLAIYWQLLIAPKFNIGTISPNFLIPFIIFIHLRFDLSFALPITFIIGLSLDLLQPAYLGLNTIAFLLISFLVYNFHHPINKKRLLIVFTSIFLLNLCYYLVFFLFQLLSGKLQGELSSVYFLTLFYNTVLSFITIYFLILLDHLKLIFRE